jgi:L-fuculose-phosphate aldolase
MNTRLEEQIRAEIVEAGRRMFERGFVASNDGNISARLDEKRLMTTPKSVSKGFMTPDMMVIVDYDGNKVSGDRDASSELPMHLEIYRNRPDVNGVVHAHPPTATGFACRGYSADAGGTGRSDHDPWQHPDCRVRHALNGGVAGSGQEIHQGTRRDAAGESRCRHLWPSVMAAYYKMETIEHFAKISLVARLLGREHLISREEVERLQGLRGYYGIAAPAPLCTDPDMPQDADQVLCQVLEAPESSTVRLVPDDTGAVPRPVGDARSALAAASRDGEIRLTYGELTALIADAIKQLRD